MTILEKNIQASGAALIKSRAVSGIKILTLRTLISVALRVVSSLCLARLLFPKDYGVFAVVSYITGLGMFLCDVGLNAALVRQDHAPTEDEATTVFWAQQAFAGVAVASIIASAPWLVQVYHLSNAAYVLIVSMALGLFLSSLRIVPMMTLERNLQFPTIARCELIENVVQTVSTITLAALGFGVWALAGGNLLRGIVGLVCVWTASPWRPEGRYQFAIVRRLAVFGIPAQLNAIVPSIAGGWMPVIVGRMLGVAAVGLVGWAANIASVPLMVSAVVNRVAFPSYSRLQTEPEALGRYVRSSIRRIGAIVSLLSPSVFIACPLIIPMLFHARWEAAIPLVQWFTLESSILTITGLLAAAQCAAGVPGERLAVTVGVGAVRWLVAYLVVSHIGLTGIGPCMFIISVSEMVLSSYLMGLRIPGGNRSLMSAFEPIVISGVLLPISLLAGSTIFGGHLFPKTVASFFVFLGMIYLRELITGGHVFQKELHALVHMMRPVGQQN